MNVENDWLNAELSTGTSIMAVEYNGGVVMGCDSRTATGTYVANRVTEKLTRVTNNIYCCRSGSAADTQAITDIVSYHLDFYRIEMGEEPPVETAAALFREICYNYRDQFSAGVIIAGWDKRKGGQVYAIPIGGMCTRQKVAIGGSGSTYVYGYVDAHYKDDLTREQCVEFVENVLTLAVTRDGSSGGVVRIGVIEGEKGMEKTIIPWDKQKKYPPV